MRSLQFLALALSVVALQACPPSQPNLVDPFYERGTVVAADGRTPLPGFQTDRYDVLFQFTNGATFQAYATGPTLISGTNFPGIVADENGQFEIASPDLGLYRNTTQTRCYDTCSYWTTSCDWDPYYQDYYCYDSCSWYTTDCYDNTYSTSMNFHQVASARSSITYQYGATNLTTEAAPVTSATALSVSALSSDGLYSSASWSQLDTFITPFTGPASSAASSASAEKNGSLVSEGLDLSGSGFKLWAANPEARTRFSNSAQAPYALATTYRTPEIRRTSCTDQSQLSDAQMAGVRKLREALGITSQQVKCRQ